MLLSPRTPFPLEILELITEELADLGVGPWKGLLKDIKNLCLASRDFLHPCRKILFHHVSLKRSRVIMRFSKVSTPDFTLRFSKLILGSPHLASYVKSLRYLISVQDLEEPEIAKSLSLLRNVEDFAFLLRDDALQTMSAEEFTAHELGKAVMGIVSTGKLKILSMKPMSFPLGAVLDPRTFLMMRIGGRGLMGAQESSR